MHLSTTNLFPKLPGAKNHFSMFFQVYEKTSKWCDAKNMAEAIFYIKTELIWGLIPRESRKWITLSQKNTHFISRINFLSQNESFFSQKLLSFFFCAKQGHEKLSAFRKYCCSKLLQLHQLLSSGGKPSTMVTTGVPMKLLTALKYNPGAPNNQKTKILMFWGCGASRVNKRPITSFIRAPVVTKVGGLPPVLSCF